MSYMMILRVRLRRFGDDSGLDSHNTKTRSPRHMILLGFLSWPRYMYMYNACTAGMVAGGLVPHEPKRR